MSRGRTRSPRWRRRCGGRVGWEETEVYEVVEADEDGDVRGDDDEHQIFLVLPGRPDPGRCDPDLFRAYPSN